MKQMKFTQIGLVLNLVVLFMACSQPKKKTIVPKTLVELEYQYLDRAIQKENTHVWGTSPVWGDDGKVHLYVAEWPIPTDKNEKFTGWYKHSQIAHYTGDSPEGPFTFQRIAVADKDGDFNAPHNPTIRKIDGKYLLCFIVNENDDLKTQRIVMYIADDLNDNWRPIKTAEKDGTVLRVPTDSAIWNYGAILGVSNPSLAKFKGKYMLYYKSVLHKPNRNLWRNRDYGYGVAIADKLEGPYEVQPNRITSDSLQLEDVYAFPVEDKMCMLSRDFGSSKGSLGGGLLWTSDDGLNFDSKHVKRAYSDLAFYVGKEKLEKASKYRGTLEGHLERPQILNIDGKPAYLYMATGINVNEEFGSSSHIFKLNVVENQE